MHASDCRSTAVRVARKAGPAVLALATLVAAHSAWAVCADGTTFPAGGYVVGQPPVPVLQNFTPNVFTGTTGSYFIPDNSTFEHNDPTQPLTGGGHNWVFDQGSTLCKVTDLGPAGGVATAWGLPPSNATECVVLPIISGGVIKNIGDIPGNGDVITPTCDPTKLSQPGAPNAANTYANQLGCSISHGVANTPQTATSYLFVAGIKGGMFSIPLNNVTTPVVGGQSGKISGPQNYYSHIPEGQKLTNAVVSKDGQFAIATSNKRLNTVFACLNPLGDPGDPTLPINPNFFVPPASTVLCMAIGNNALQVDLTDVWGSDNQPYFGGQRVVNAFGGVPGGTSNVAWPQCIWKNNGSLSLLDAFQHNRQGGCGNALPDFGFSSANIVQPSGSAYHGQYIYMGPVGGTAVQFKLTVDPFSGQTSYAFRTYITGLSLTTGIGVADDLKSVIFYNDPSAIGAAAQEALTKVPLCEDM
ncbi:MAG TPA: hypothetical protein VFP65_30160 [Anaeromyxobacteraceae bacterium]|nr:hypothetical protein [Anaeromyxobacteraceae bacterium]